METLYGSYLESSLNLRANMRNRKKSIILVDEPIENDHRVMQSLKKYDDYDLINCSDIYHTKVSLVSLYSNILSILLKSLLFTPFYWIRLKKKYNLKPKNILSGLKASIKASYKAEQIATYIKVKYDGQSIAFIHANDLMCGVVGMTLSKHFNAEFVYDAHEVEFHRNRKNSLLRVVYDILCEQRITKTANKIIVVNKPIKTLYMEIYNVPEYKMYIINNNHFTPYLKYSINSFKTNNDKVAIVYVGAGINGRKLESLSQECIKYQVSVYGFFLSETPQVAYQNNWILGSVNYLPDLLNLTKVKRLVVWCCTDDLCLSYRLSLPNKFFQAMALGIPVIAYKDTYLADIIIENNLGYVYNDNNFEDIINHLSNSEKYYGLLKSISLFQEKLFLENMEL